MGLMGGGVEISGMLVGGKVFGLGKWEGGGGGCGGLGRLICRGGRGV